MRRIDPPKLYYGYATGKYAKQLIEPWMLPFRDKLSVWQSAIINPMVILGEDTVNNDIDIFEKVIFPQTSYIDEPYIYYQTHKDLKIQSIDQVLLDGIPISDYYKPVDSDSTFLAMEYDCLVPYIEEDFFLDHDTYGKGIIGYGDQQGNTIKATVWHIPSEEPYTYTANYSRAIREGIPDGILNVDVASKIYEQDQEVLIGSYTEVNLFENVVRSIVSREDYHPVVLMSSDISNLRIRPDIDDRTVDYYIMFPSEQKTYKKTLDFNENGVVDEEDYKMMRTAMGKTYETIDPEEWNEIWSHFDLNNDGRISKADMDMFMAYYPSSIWPDKAILILRKMGGYVLTERTILGNTTTTSTFATNAKGGFMNIKNYSNDPTVIGRFPKTALDVTYDSRSDVYYYSSSVEKGVIGTKFNKLGSIIERKKFTLGEYFDWDPRGVKWKDGYVYLLVVKSGQCKILRYDTLTTYDYTYDKVIDILCEFNDPTFLTINDEDRFIIGDGSKLHIMKNIYRRALIKDNRLLLSSHPSYDWVCYDNSGVFSFGDTSSGIVSGIASGIVSGEINLGPELLWNVFDEYALGTGLERLPGEDNDSLLYRIMGVFRRPPGINHLGLANSVQRDLALRYYTPVKGYFSLRFEPNLNRIRELEIYSDNSKIDVRRIVNTEEGYRFLDGSGRLIIELNGADIVNIGPILNKTKNLDIVYWTFDSEDNEVSIHDRWDNFDYISMETDEPYVRFHSLGDEDYLLDPDNGYFSVDGQITEKLLRIIEKADSYSNDRWHNAITDESFYDMTSYDGNVVVIPTEYDICVPSGMLAMSGNGWKDDIKHIGIKSDIALRGTAASEEKWHPVLYPGFFYIEEEEYYCFHDKATFITSGVMSVEDVKATSEAYSNFIVGLETSTSPTDINDPGVEEEDFKLFDFDHVFQLDMVPDLESPLILTEILVPFWEPSGFYANYSESESGTYSGIWVPLIDLPGSDIDSGLVDSVDVDNILGVTRLYSDHIFIPDLMIEFNVNKRFADAHDVCDIESGFYASGIPNRAGLLLEALISGFITIEELENKYLARDNLIDEVIKDLDEVITINLEVVEENQTTFDIGMVVPNPNNALLVINGLPQFIDTDYNIIDTSLVFDPTMAGFELGTNDEVSLLVWNDIMTYLGNFTYPLDLYWINGFGLIGSGIVSRQVDYDSFVYNPIFNAIEVYQSGVYVLNYETEQSDFQADDVDINHFNTSFSDGYLLLEDETKEETIIDTLKVMSLVITSRKTSLVEDDTIPCVAIALAEANRPISKDLTIEILRDFEDDLGPIEIIDRRIINDIYEELEFERDIVGILKEKDLHVHVSNSIWKNVAILKRRATLIIDGEERSSATITTDFTGSYPFQLASPVTIDTSYVVDIALSDGEKTFIHSLLVKKSGSDAKYMSIQTESPLRKAQKYYNVSNQATLILDILPRAASDVIIYGAQDYYQWMKDNFDSSMEPTAIDIADIIIHDNQIEYALVSPITGEYILEYREVEYNEILLDKHYIYMV